MQRETQQNTSEVLSDALRTIASCSQASKIHTLILQQLARITDAQGGSLFAFDGGQLILKHTLEEGRQLPQSIRLPLHPSSPSATAMEQQEALLVSHIEEGHGSGWGAYNDGSFMVLPLYDDSDNIMCMINLHNKRQPPFLKEDLKTAKTFLGAASNMVRILEERELLEGRQRYFLDLLNTLPMGFLLIREDGTILDANALFASMIGLTPQECLERNYFQLSQECENTGERAFMKQVPQHGASSGFVKHFTGKTGERVPALVFYRRFTLEKPSQFLLSVAPGFQ